MIDDEKRKFFAHDDLTLQMIRFDIEDAFQKIGRVSDVWVARKPPGFAFIEMEVRTTLFRPWL